MALKKMTFNERRKSYIVPLISIIENSWIIKSKLSDFKSMNVINNYSIKENVDWIYGKAPAQDDMEWLMCKYLLLYIAGMHAINVDMHALDYTSFNYADNKKEFIHLNFLLKNSKSKIESFFENEFIIKWIKFNKFKFETINYEPIETKTIIENLKNVPANIGDMIKLLLKKNITEEESIGFISKIHAEFESEFPKDQKYLNQIDKVIYEKTWTLAKKIINKVDGAKGHKGKSQLTVKDISHNFALLASLIYKLISINDENENLKKVENNE
ncbi:hypothetical protein [Candidatus Mycoplasma mahonii]|uniref:hypothetical protein n=1 Tax=Candidatus Mycoplasma mahonii TaxID=3004105 RepID=UPI0026F1A885|nr:hypothetical protein [Candidatus Mycoplasma mahonii]WKX02281.1 hypothetical protein O3I44_02655 [Candidatus Mycoplasma mahonii]